MAPTRKHIDPSEETEALWLDAAASERDDPHPEIAGPDVDEVDDVDPDFEDIDPDDALTAQPLIDEDDETPGIAEPGLSIELEDLARQALVEATQQDNFESSRGVADTGMHVINPFVITPE